MCARPGGSLIQCHCFTPRSPLPQLAALDGGSGPGEDSLVDTDDLLPSTDPRSRSLWSFSLDARGSGSSFRGAPSSSSRGGNGQGASTSGSSGPNSDEKLSGRASLARSLRLDDEGSPSAKNRKFREQTPGAASSTAGYRQAYAEEERGTRKLKEKKKRAAARSGNGGVSGSRSRAGPGKGANTDFEIWHIDGAKDMAESLSSSGGTTAFHPATPLPSASGADMADGAFRGSREFRDSLDMPGPSMSMSSVAASEGAVLLKDVNGTAGSFGVGGWDDESNGDAYSWDGMTLVEALSDVEDRVEGEVDAGQERQGEALGEPSMGPKAPEILTIAKEPVYQVLEVNAEGQIHQREVGRRQLLRFSGLTQRDIRRIDPSLWMTNSSPALLVRDNAILLKLGSLRAISTARTVLLFDFNSAGAQSFLDILLDRLRVDADAQLSGGVPVPFELEVVESALISRTQRLESALMDVEPRVLSLLDALPTQLSADNLEELRLCKQALVELGAKAGALRQMLIELLEQTSDLRRITAIGRHCRVGKDGFLDCSTSSEKTLAEEEEQEVEMLLEYYLQRCDSCHGQAEKLLDSARETEDSLAVNLSSRRLEVSRLELLLQVGTFAAALGALVAGIFGMNLRSRLEENVTAFWFTTIGILAGSFLLFVAMFAYLRRRRIL